MKRTQTIGYSTDGHCRYQDGEMKPLIRLSNRFLVHIGFRVGRKINVHYKKGVVTITRNSK
jgi:hypothetical protein